VYNSVEYDAAKPPGTITLQPAEPPMTLVAFDFDGTLSESEMMVLLGERKGIAEEIRDVTARAMRGELSYAESLYRRAELLEGLPEHEVAAAFEQVTMRPGAAELLERLNDAGHTTAILTGGFTPGVEAALTRDGTEVDLVVANGLPIADGALTGDAEGPLIEGTKDEALQALSSEEGGDIADTVAVGDGANDLPMLKVAELAVGFEPKDPVVPHCDEIVESMDELGALFQREGLC